MGQRIAPKSHLSIATLFILLLAITMEIWDRGCGPFRPIFAVLATLGHVGNTISPWGKRPSQRGVGIFVAYDRARIAIEVRICSSGLAGVMQLTVRPRCQSWPFLLFCAPARPSPPGTAGIQRDSKPNANAEDEGGYQGPWMKTSPD